MQLLFIKHFALFKFHIIIIISQRLINSLTRRMRASAETDIKKDPSFLTGLISLTWLRYPKTRGLTKHHETKVTIFVGLTK